MFFELLHAKPFRIIWKLPQKVSLGSETCKIEPTYLFMNFHENVVLGLQITLFDGFNVLFSFLAEKWYRTNMKLPQEASFGPETCETRPKAWFLASGFCLMRLGGTLRPVPGEPSGATASKGF